MSKSEGKEIISYSVEMCIPVNILLLYQVFYFVSLFVINYDSQKQR